MPQFYFEPDSFIAQQFLLPFSGQPYQLPPTSVQNDGSNGVAYNAKEDQQDIYT